MAVVVYEDVPDDDYLMAFSYGLSSAHHPEWVDARPELMIAVKSSDHAWALCMGEIVKDHRHKAAITYGSILHFREQIAKESAMTSFLVFADTWLEPEQQQIVLSDRTVRLAQLYPIYEQEAPIILEAGIEKFFWEMGIDFDDVKRPPVA